ncbi:MAG: carbohydrate-binding family 9-like protein [Cyclobacteriaceae bacterium]|nr:carbohydrate-binding family 9-like protein [Cyclobacteriaceae bacterium]
MLIKKTKDFEPDGQGEAENWKETSWVSLPLSKKSFEEFETRLKVLYSEKGMYFLFECEDDLLNATMTEDYADLWLEDVVEVFLWPDEHFPVYFEYEISPLGYELPIIVPNKDGHFLGWKPWKYGGDRKILRATSVRGGEKESMAAIESWTAEFFIPFELLKPLIQKTPASGEKWKANFYRIDYKNDQMQTWSWRNTYGSFHKTEYFDWIEFE